jgi:peptidoglycan/xylan/chitin deacetylase (PgdA/CDA1 family)
MSKLPATAGLVPIAPGRNDRPWALVHLDLDGAKHIYRAHGWSYRAADDPLFETGLRGALEVFAGSRIRATLFVIAEDLLDPRKRDLIRAAAEAGHEIASHSLTHPRLTTLEPVAKRREIAESRERLATELGVAVRGFRAPGFGIDRECLELIDEAGYTYDSSVLSPAVFVKSAAFDRAAAPHRPLSGKPLIELPLPSSRRFSLPFHPSYSLVVGDWYYRTAVKQWRRHGAAFILLFHLTDFAEPVSSGTARGWKQRLFTLSYLSAARKRTRCREMLEFAKGQFHFADTTQLLATCVDAPAKTPHSVIQ